MAIVTKTEEPRPLPWLAPQQDELNRIQAVGLLRLPSLKKNRIPLGFDRQTLRLFQESVWEHSCREWTSTLYYLGNRLWRPSFPKFAFFIPKIYSPGVIHYTKQAWWMTLILKHVQGIITFNNFSVCSMVLLASGFKCIVNYLIMFTWKYKFETVTVEWYM